MVAAEIFSAATIRSAFVLAIEIVHENDRVPTTHIVQGLMKSLFEGNCRRLKHRGTEGVNDILKRSSFV